MMQKNTDQQLFLSTVEEKQTEKKHPFSSPPPLLRFSMHKNVDSPCLLFFVGRFFPDILVLQVKIHFQRVLFLFYFFHVKHYLRILNQ